MGLVTEVNNSLPTQGGGDTERAARQADRLNNGLPGSLDHAAEKLFKAEYPDRDYWSIKPDARISWHRKAWVQAAPSEEPLVGCVVVPREPTEAMHMAGLRVTEKGLAPSWTALNVWSAMLAAA